MQNQKSTSRSSTEPSKMICGKGVDIYESVTNNIISLIENQKTGKSISWRKSTMGGLPTNFKTKAAYNGINVLILWSAAADAGFSSNFWLTFKQAQELGGFVRKGSKGVTCCFYKQGSRMNEETNELETFPVLNTFTVFNIEQIEGLTVETENLEAVSIFNQNQMAEEILIKSGADIREEGDRAFYRPSTDQIYLPTRDRFENEHSFYAVSLHELTHWTGAKHRLGRDFTGRFGNEAYAFEELVAELGAAFLSAEIGFVSETLEGHASYLDNWLSVLKNDKKAIFTAASAATKAAALIMAKYKPETETEEAI